MTIYWENREMWLPKLSHRNRVQFTLFCAKLVICGTDDKRAHRAVAIVKRWLDGKASAEECIVYGSRAFAASSTGSPIARSAALASAYAAYAAADIDGTICAYLASSCVGDTLASDEAKISITQCLRELYLASLPEEERSCWLVQACV